MRPWAKPFLKIWLAPLVSVWLALTAHAAEPAADARHPDVRVLIDVSGSMKRNDPNNLRAPALELLLRLFPAGSRAGVWTFGSGVAALAPHQPVADQWRSNARGRIGKITSTDLYTDIPAALARATYDLDRLDPNYRPSVILLTDGMVDIAKSPAENAAARQRLLDELLPRLRRAGVTVHTVALSSFADRELMERLAADTAGLFAVAETAEQLNRVFLQALDAAAPTEQLPLKDNRFTVDSAIDEFTALVFHSGTRPVALITPNGETHRFTAPGKGVKWLQGKGYDLITVAKPAPGEWRIDADLEHGSRVTIVSNLSLSASRLPDGLFAGAPTGVVAALKEQDEILKRPDLLKLVTFRVDVQRRADDKQWTLDLSAGQPVPADGYYRGDLVMLQEPGIYDLSVTADGKTFQRSRRQTVVVREPFGIKVTSTETTPPDHLVRLTAQRPDIDPAATVVTATIKQPDSGDRSVAVPAAGERDWQLEQAGAAGRVEVQFEARGRYRNGDEFTYRSPLLTLDAQGGSALAPAAQPEPAPAPAAEAEPESAPAQPAAEPAPKSDPVAKPAWRKWLLYGGLAVGNLVILGLGYVAFRMIMGGGKSRVLEEGDENDEGEEEVPAGKAAPAKGKAPMPSLDELDLPDDAIDIDPAADKKKK